MASGHFANNLKQKLLTNIRIIQLQSSSIHSTPCLSTVKAGRNKPTPKQNKPLTYEQAFPPPHIAHRKSWNTWNTSTIEGGLRKSEIIIDDIFIRKFIYGTFPGMLCSEVVIKRQYNIIRLAFFLTPKIKPEKILFLIGYTEELLSFWLHCIVKLEIQIIYDVEKQLTFKYI